LGGFTSHALAPRGSRGQHLSLSGIPVSPINRVAWVFKLRQLLWQDASMFVVVGMDASFSLKKYGIQVSCLELEKTQTESGLF